MIVRSIETSCASVLWANARMRDNVCQDVEVEGECFWERGGVRSLDMQVDLDSVGR